MAFDPERFKKQLQELGEDRVRELVATGAMSVSKKVPLATEFLRQEDQRRSDFSKREQIAIARSAKNAAWQRQ